MARSRMKDDSKMTISLLMSSIVTHFAYFLIE